MVNESLEENQMENAMNGPPATTFLGESCLWTYQGVPFLLSLLCYRTFSKGLRRRWLLEQIFILLCPVKVHFGGC